MGISLPALQWAFDKLEDWLSSASREQQDAVDLFLDALQKTQQYLGQLEKDKGYANAKSEEELGELWNTAAKAVRPHDEDLYQRCFAKACHWSGSKRFKNTEISDINISIEKMIEIALDKGRS